MGSAGYVGLSIHENEIQSNHEEVGTVDGCEIGITSWKRWSTSHLRFQPSFWWFMGFRKHPQYHLTYGPSMLPSGKLLHNYMDNHHFSWVNQLFLWPFSIVMLVCQRVHGFANGDKAIPCHFVTKTQGWGLIGLLSCNLQRTHSSKFGFQLHIYLCIHIHTNSRKEHWLFQVIYMYVGFLKWGHPQIIHFNGRFHDKPSILIYFGVPPFMETPICTTMTRLWSKYEGITKPPNYCNNGSFGLVSSAIS